MTISAVDLLAYAAPDRLEVLRRAGAPVSMTHEVLLCRRIRSDGVALGHEIVTGHAIERALRPGSTAGTPTVLPDERTARALAVAQWREEVRAENQPQWATLDFPGQVLNVVTRVWKGEWMGVADDLVLTCEQVAGVLGLPSVGGRARVTDAAHALEGQRLLSVRDSAIYPYAERFHFPDEIRAMLVAMIEEPMGWPNGDAGEGAVQRIETAIQDHGGVTHGARLVWPENYPHIAPQYLLRFGLRFLDAAVRAHREGTRTVFGSEAARQEAIEEIRTLAVALEATAPAPLR